MAPLRSLVALVTAAGWTVPAAADPVERWAAQIGEASSRFDVPAEWIRRVMRVESGGRTMLGARPIVSRAGAMGLMQLMPGTWRDMRALLGLGFDPHDPRANILAGTYYLRLMYERFGYPGLFAAYNAGPARYAGVLSGGRTLPAETRLYVDAIGAAKRGRIVIPARSTLFALRSSAIRVASPQSSARPAAGLFVALSRPAPQ